MSDDVCRRERITANERDAIINIMMVVDALEKAKPKIWRRAALAKNGRRDFALAFASAERVFDHLLETIPLEQLVTLKHNINHLTYTVGMGRPGLTDDTSNFGMWLSWDAIGQLLSTASEHCMVCIKDKQEQRSCPLAKAIDTLPNTEKPNDGGCGYFGAWGQ